MLKDGKELKETGFPSFLSTEKNCSKISNSDIYNELKIKNPDRIVSTNQSKNSRVANHFPGNIGLLDNYQIQEYPNPQNGEVYRNIDCINSSLLPPLNEFNESADDLLPDYHSFSTSSDRSISPFINDTGNTCMLSNFINNGSKNLRPDQSVIKRDSKNSNIVNINSSSLSESDYNDILNESNVNNQELHLDKRHRNNEVGEVNDSHFYERSIFRLPKQSNLDKMECSDGEP